MLRLHFMGNFVNTRKNFPDAQKLSGWQCHRATRVFGTLPLTTLSLILGAVTSCIMVSCSTLLSIVHALSFPQPRSSRVVGVEDPICMHCALSLSAGQPFAGKIVDFWQESLHRRPCVLSVCPLFSYRSALHRLMTRVDTMREEKRCD